MADLPARPAKLWTVIVFGYVQAAFNLLVGVLLFWEAGEEADVGRAAPAGTIPLGLLSFVLACVVGAGAVFLTRGATWARGLIAVVQVLSIIAGLITMTAVFVQGGTVLPTAFVPLVLAFVVLLMLFDTEVSEWFQQVAERRVERRFD
jgi:hypothetical protein